ncbi:MAG: hypothetical protein AAF378_14160 [Cyanobacteria bacterium P01_A01_bin.84]
MTYYPDLSKYKYLHSRVDINTDMKNVGWLDYKYDYQKGSVPNEVVHHLIALAKSPQNLTRGFHRCNLCESKTDEFRKDTITLQDPFGGKSNGEIHIFTPKNTFVAPVLIVHYIIEHRYCPPQEFIDAVVEDYQRLYSDSK